ncbi:MAG: SAM-dependent methyltransferase [Bacteroidetes bacterium GWD2_45_23]|nr:MAG: SAM-dependent methyltransferase [Bacteroidetes bacterium GWC2_46_850]OFX66590.1 MAG: SAM-dependent methyltransferase [Bacteroidetes bacterium GWC1_47_7]OFX87221.1 MAG: SAM-dependent methyltransferase [Bacteroidetes bacterium GWD2_45_23]HAR37658.1 RlmI/RlmK family 23S rRNA methyltransferase [Porphyromonadaceae bacterium]HBB01763.1 RlmI/RlmK family 23S rRNA methyltransferase [Porphyromonadaceae bacterium]
MNEQNVIMLRPGKEESLKRFHPWVFSGAIARKPDLLAEGDVVRVVASNGNFLGVGHYQIGSIAVRILSFHDVPVDTAFYATIIEQAYRLRQTLQLIRPDNNTFRLVHGEGDHLPGLIVDIYGGTAVIQAHSVGMHKDLNLIVAALKQVLPEDLAEHVFYKSEGTLPYKADINAVDTYLLGGEQVQDVALENGLKFHIDWLKGQKTGFFIDQRDNRTLLEQYAEGRHVLNMFCYTGGFSVYALRGGAASVDSVDSSPKAVTLTDRNVTLNFGEEPRHNAVADDAFKFLKQVPGSKYDLIVLDPPAFAKHRGAINNALQGYKKLNLSAMEKLAPGGLLFTFSCSQAITRDQFRLAVFSAAAISGRRVRILHQLTQPADHPVNIYHPEGEYLKGLVLWVE